MKPDGSHHASLAVDEERPRGAEPQENRQPQVRAHVEPKTRQRRRRRRDGGRGALEAGALQRADLRLREEE